MNVLWQQPDGVLALTSVFDGSDPEDHADLLKSRGDIPADWVRLAVNVDWPDTGYPHEAHRWDGVRIVVDAARASEVSRVRAIQDRAEAVERIVVTTQAGHAFDGDEVSQERMNRAITVLQATGTPSVPWVLADNTVIQASAAELVEALALAGAEQARLWVLS